MAKQYNIQFHDDGTFTSVPSSISITPGTSVSFIAEAQQTKGTSLLPLDLTNCSLIATLINSAGKIRLYQSGPPAIMVTNAERGRFTLSLPPLLTEVLVPSDNHTLEIKSINLVTNERLQIAYLPITINPSSLISE